MATAEPEPKLPECVPPLYGDIPDKTPPEKSQLGPDLVDVEQVYLTWQWNQVDGDKPKRSGGDHRGETWATERRRLAADTIMPGEGTKTRKGVANAIDREKPYNQYVLTGIGLSCAR